MFSMDGVEKLTLSESACKILQKFIFFGIDLEPDSYVNTAISIVRTLKMEPEDSHASLTKILLDTKSDVF